MAHNTCLTGRHTSHSTHLAIQTTHLSRKGKRLTKRHMSRKKIHRYQVKCHMAHDTYLTRRHMSHNTYLAAAIQTTHVSRQGACLARKRVPRKMTHGSQHMSRMKTHTSHGTCLAIQTTHVSRKGRCLATHFFFHSKRVSGEKASVSRHTAQK